MQGLCADMRSMTQCLMLPALDRQADPLGGQLGGRLPRSAPLLTEELVQIERRVSFQHVIHGAR
jgi:hypothetical protein